jgi:hypothetical protein
VILWWVQWGDKLKFLNAVAKKGIPVPALASRPTLPDYMTDILACYMDLVKDGEISWADFYAWAERFGMSDTEYVWEVINNARREVDKWQSSKAPSSAPGLPQTGTKR